MIELGLDRGCDTGVGARVCARHIEKHRGRVEGRPGHRQLETHSARIDASKMRIVKIMQCTLGELDIESGRLRR